MSGELATDIATVGAIFLGIVYIIGGLIVNLNLTRRGVVEYQILKVKFLAVGIIFIFQFLGILIFTSIPVVLLALVVFNLPTTRVQELVVQFMSIPSILASLALLYVWSRYPPNTKSFFGSWLFWFLFSVLASLFPLFVALRQGLLPAWNLNWTFSSLLAAFSGVLALLAQIYHYSSFYYGRPAALGALDPIGMGIPTRVDIACEESVAPDLRELGLVIPKNIIRDIYLIDETSEHYIVSQEQVPNGDGNDQTYKIRKDLVKSILHKPDHMRKLSGELIDKKEKDRKRSR